MAPSWQWHWWAKIPTLTSMDLMNALELSLIHVYLIGNTVHRDGACASADLLLLLGVCGG
jgi:hypothetical protein